MSAQRVSEGKCRGGKKVTFGGLPGDGPFAVAVSLVFAALGNGTGRMLFLLTFKSSERRRPGDV